MGALFTASRISLAVSLFQTFSLFITFAAKPSHLFLLFFSVDIRIARYSNRERLELTMKPFKATPRRYSGPGGAGYGEQWNQQGNEKKLHNVEVGRNFEKCN